MASHRQDLRGVVAHEVHPGAVTAVLRARRDHLGQHLRGVAMREPFHGPHVGLVQAVATGHGVGRPLGVPVGIRGRHVRSDGIVPQVALVHRVDHLGRDQHGHRGSLLLIPLDVGVQLVVEVIAERPLQLRQVLHGVGALPLGALPLLGGDLGVRGKARPVGLDERALQRVGERLLGGMRPARLVPGPFHLAVDGALVAHPTSLLPTRPPPAKPEAANGTTPNPIVGAFCAALKENGRRIFGLRLLLGGLGRRSGRLGLGWFAAWLGGCLWRRTSGRRGCLWRRTSRRRARLCRGTPSCTSTPGARTTSWSAGASPRPPAPSATSAEAPAAPAELAARTTVHPWDLGLALGQARLERRVARPLVANRHVIELELAFHLAPSGRQQEAVPSGGRLAQLVGVRDLHIEVLDPNFLELGHGGQGSRGPKAAPAERGVTSPGCPRGRSGPAPGAGRRCRTMGRGRCATGRTGWCA